MCNKSLFSSSAISRILKFLLFTIQSGKVHSDQWKGHVAAEGGALDQTQPKTDHRTRHHGAEEESSQVSYQETGSGSWKGETLHGKDVDVFVMETIFPVKLAPWKQISLQSLDGDFFYCGGRFWLDLI